MSTYFLAVRCDNLLLKILTQLKVEFWKMNAFIQYRELLIKIKQRLKKTNVAIFTWLYLHDKWLLSHFAILVVEIFEVLLKGPFFPLHRSPLQNFTLRLWLVSFNPSCADLEQRENIHLNYYWHTSLCTSKVLWRPLRTCWC